MAEPSDGLVGIPESPRDNFSPPPAAPAPQKAEASEDKAEKVETPAAPAAAAEAMPRLSPPPVSDIRRPVPAPVPVPRPKLQKGALPLLLAAAGIGAGFDALFWGQLPGINVPLFVGTLLAALFTLGSREGTAPKWRNTLLVVPPLLFFAVMCAVRASGALTAINIVACLILTALIAIYYAADDVIKLKLSGFLGAPVLAFGHALAEGGYAIGQGMGEVSVRKDSRGRMMSLVRGLLLAAPILAVFGALLYSADAVFAHLIDNIANAIPLRIDADAETLIGRSILIVSVSYLVAGGFAFALLRPRHEQGRPQTVKSPAALVGSLGFTEGMIVLGSVTALFTTFVVVQFAYLFGGAARVLAVPGLTYAEYARRGFAELNWTALLTLALIGSLRHVTRRDGAPGHARTFQTVGTGLLALTLVLLASAFQRMSAYETAYGASELRLYVDGFIVWLGVAIAWFGATLWRERLGFGIGAYLCIIGFSVTMNLLNPDAQITTRNAAHWSAHTAANPATRQRLDAHYLNNLSDDAVPSLLDLYRGLPAGAEKSVLGSGLRERLNNLRSAEKERGWPSTHAARARALSLLSGAEKELPATVTPPDHWD